MWINKGILHVLNNSTATLTLSNHEFDMITDKTGHFLEKSMEKVMKSHDRRPGEFKQHSKIKELIERYSRNEVDLYEVSSIIAKLLFQKRDRNESEDKTGLFIMEVGDTDGNHRIDYIVGMEFKRVEKYQINIKGSNNSVVLNPMLLSNANPKRTPLFTINLNTMEISILEDDRGYLEQILEVELKDSINTVLLKVRKCLYNTLTKVEQRETTYQDIVTANNEDKIDEVNKFELSMSESIRSKGLINFEELAKEVFINRKMQQKEFMRRIKQIRIPIELEALSRNSIELKMIIKMNEKKEKRIKLANGIEVIVPADINDLRPIMLQEVNGELVEVVENA